jgi:enamine deaminase RidA (YjgF/YER057c/UK114 family)
MPILVFPLFPTLVQIQIRMADIIRHGTTPRWSDLVVHRGIAYFVEVPEDPLLDPRSQFEQLFRQVDERLALAKSSRKALLQVLIYLPFPEDLPLFNQLWDAWIPRGFAPSRACIHTQLAAPGYRAELIITAACDAP